MDSKKEHTYTCLGCGEEVECGLMSAMEHYETCKRDAPNSNIETHILEEKIAELQDEHAKKMMKAGRYMSDEEKEKYLMYFALAGPDGTICVGEKLFNEIRDFENEMIEKYVACSVEMPGEKLRGLHYDPIKVKRDLREPIDPEEAKWKKQQNKYRSRFHKK